MVGPDDLEGLLQTRCFYDFMILKPLCPVIQSIKDFLAQDSDAAHILGLVVAKEKSLRET